METDRVEAVRTLLVEAEQAHGVYEATELNGVYDEEWPRWYAAHAVDDGFGAVLGHEVSVDDLGRFLATTYAEYERIDPKPAEPWSAYIARRIVSELGAKDEDRREDQGLDVSRASPRPRRGRRTRS